MTAYKIVKTYTISNSFGGDWRMTPAWNVIDTRDGFVIDTFSLKRDAVQWIKAAVAA